MPVKKIPAITVADERLVIPEFALLTGDSRRRLVDEADNLRLSKLN